MEFDEMNGQGSEKHEGEGTGHEKHEYKKHLFTVSVNEHPVKLLGNAATGVKIKTAAIEQGVDIQLSFVLEEDLPDGARRIGNDEEVQLREGLRFTAREHTVTISVNEKPVKLLGHAATGDEIKTAAIEQGVDIRLSFVLEEDLPDGARRIGNDEEVQLRENLRFAAREHAVTVSVNEQPVVLPGHVETGAEIKAAAIAQGVLIQPNFVLQEELPNGTDRTIGDSDKVHLREHLRFTALSPDDNS
jgi:hypothetical protein